MNKLTKAQLTAILTHEKVSPAIIAWITSIFQFLAPVVLAAILKSLGIVIPTPPEA